MLVQSAPRLREQSLSDPAGLEPRAWVPNPRHAVSAGQDRYLAFEAAEALSAECKLAGNGSANRRARRWNSIRILHPLSSPLAESRAAAVIPNWRQAI